jgi:hypothetical protein
VRRAAWTGCLVLAACGAGHRAPCASGSDCPDGATCHAGLCSIVEPARVPSATTRAVLEPSLVATLGRARGGPVSIWPEAFALGDRTAGATTAYVRFVAWQSAGPVARALLVLQPIEPNVASPGLLTVRAWRIEEPWDRTSLASEGRPELGLPKATAVGAPGENRALRIDVTELARYWSEHPESNHGLALIAAEAGGRGTTFAARGVKGPRLELYLR